MIFKLKNFYFKLNLTQRGLPGGSVVKNLPTSAGDVRDTGLIPGLGRSPRTGNGYPHQYSCLENSMDRGAWWATVHGVAKSWTLLSKVCVRLHTHTHTHTHTLSQRLNIKNSLTLPFIIYPISSAAANPVALLSKCV